MDSIRSPVPRGNPAGITHHDHRSVRQCMVVPWSWHVENTSKGREKREPGQLGRPPEVTPTLKAEMSVITLFTACSWAHGHLSLVATDALLSSVSQGCFLKHCALVESTTTFPQAEQFMFVQTGSLEDRRAVVRKWADSWRAAVACYGMSSGNHLEMVSEHRVPR